MMNFMFPLQAKLLSIRGFQNVVFPVLVLVFSISLFALKISYFL